MNQQKAKGSHRGKNVSSGARARENLACSVQACQVPRQTSVTQETWGCLVPRWLCICISGEHPDCLFPASKARAVIGAAFPFSQILYVRNKMKTAPQITTSLIIYQNFVLNKHNRPRCPQKDRSQLEIPILL